jgi:hypothetical protein
VRDALAPCVVRRVAILNAVGARSQPADSGDTTRSQAALDGGLPRGNAAQQNSGQCCDCWFGGSTSLPQGGVFFADVLFAAARRGIIGAPVESPGF